jgi:DNA-binding NarL/FixJ family response regulator
MKILLAEKSKSLVSALMLVLTQIKDTGRNKIGSIFHVDSVNNLYSKLKKEKPDVLIINGGFVNHKTREAMPVLQKLYPAMSILILSIDPGMEEKYQKIGIGNFILKGDSAEKFYNSMNDFLKKEQIKVSI